jgi:hypothetical protein
MDDSPVNDGPEESSDSTEYRVATEVHGVSEEGEEEEVAFPSLFTRFIDVFFSPGKAMEAVARNPAWVGALLVGVFLIALATALIPFEMVMDGQRQAALEAGRDVPEMPEAVTNVMRYVSPIIALFMVTIISFLVAGLYWLIFSFVLGDDGRYRQYLAVGTHASLITAVVLLALVPLKLMTGDAALTLNLGNILFFLPEGYLAAAAKALDLIGVWSALVVAQGAHAIDSKRSFVSAAAILLTITFAIALIVGYLTSR